MESDSESVQGGASPHPTAPDAPPAEAAGRPQWLHPASPFFDLLAHIRSLLIPLALAFFGAARDEWFWHVLAVIFLAMSLVAQLFHFFTFRYWLTATDLETRSGLLFRQARTIPLDKIQNIDFVQNILHRMFGVAEVRIETASGTAIEAKLRVLSISKLEALRAAVRQRIQSLPGHPAMPSAIAPESSLEPNEHLAEGSAAPSADVELLRLNPKHLIAAGLMNDRGIVMVGVAIAAAYQFDVLDSKWVRRIWAQVPWPHDWLSGAATVLVGLAVAIVALRILSVAWFLTRFFDYRLERSGDELHVRCGLLTRVRSSIPRRRIQYISVQQNWLMRRFGYATVRLETAGGSGAGEEGESNTLMRRWFVPIVPMRELTTLLGALRDELLTSGWHDWRWQLAAPRTAARLRRLAAIKSILLLLAASGLAWQWGTWWIVVGAIPLVPLLFWWEKCKSRSFGLVRTDWGLAYRSGVLTRRMSITFFDRIQVVTWKQSPFDRRWQMAGLVIDTAGAGPAEHEMDIRYLEHSVAAAEFDEIRLQAAQRHLRWR